MPIISDPVYVGDGLVEHAPVTQRDLVGVSFALFCTSAVSRTFFVDLIADVVTGVLASASATFFDVVFSRGHMSNLNIVQTFLWAVSFP